MDSKLMRSNLSREQLAGACQVLSGAAGFADLWTLDGPTDVAEGVRDAMRTAAARAAGVADWEALLVRLAWDVWDGSGRVTAAELLSLSGPLLETVGTLLAAMGKGPRAVDEWLRLERGLTTYRPPGDVFSEVHQRRPCGGERARRAPYPRGHGPSCGWAGARGDPGQWSWHHPRQPAPHLRALLHHQAARRGHRAGPVHLPRHHHRFWR